MIDFQVSKAGIGSCHDRWSFQGLFIWIITVYCAAFGRSNRPNFVQQATPDFPRGLLFFDAPAGAQREEARR